MKPLNVLHLLEPADGEEAVLACRAALDIPGVNHSVWIIGNQSHEQFARERGVDTTDRIVPPLRAPELAARRASHLFDRRYWGPTAPLPTPDLLMCWSVGMMGLTRLMVGKRGVMRCGVLLRSRRTLAPGSLEFRRESYALADVTTIAMNESIRAVHARSASVGRGLTFLKDNVRLFDPPVPTSPHAGQRYDRDQLRHELGVPEDHRIITLLADPPSAGDAKRFTFLLGLIYAGRQRVSGIVPVGSARLGRAARYLREHDRRWGLIVSEWPLEKRLAVSDAAVVLPAEEGGSAWSSHSCGPVSVAAAMSMGVPVFSTDDAVERTLLDGPENDSKAGLPSVELPKVELAGSHETGVRLSDHCLATNFGHDGLMNRIAGRMAPALRDSEMLSKLSIFTRARANAMRAHDAFQSDLLALWMEIANSPIVRAGLPIPPSIREFATEDSPAPLPRNQSAPA